MSVLLLALAIAAQDAPPTPEQMQTWFEAGQYQQVVDAAAQVTQPEAKFIVALSHERLGHVDEARQAFSGLSSGVDPDPWTLIGRSARSLVVPEGAAPDPAALDDAQSAIEQALQILAPEGQDAPSATGGPALALANYELGQVLTYRRDYAQAAEAFERTSTLSPSFAYAHYHAGMCHRELRQLDQMVVHLDRFLELAPDAPERVRVRAIMRAVRGR